MALELKQHLKLQQQLVITPQLQQAIKLLQLSQLDLVENIQQELLENPALEEIPGTEIPEKSEAEKALDASCVAVKSELIDQNNGKENTDQDWLKVLESYQTSPRLTGGIRGTIHEDLPPIEANLVSTDSLSDHLRWQMRMQHCTEGERRAAAAMLMNLDERGYLILTLEQVAEEVEVDLEDAEGAQMIIQSLDPPGCASMDLAECLVVQARIRYPEDPFMVEIIQNHLGDFEKRNYQAVARAMGLDLEDIIEYHKMIREFEPWPGRGYVDVEPQYITPDVHMFKLGGEWQILLNEDGMPKLRVSNYYRTVLAGAGSKEDRAYIKEKLDSADFLIKSIYKRQSTIFKVVKCILDRQRDFFEKGPEYLTPMVLRDVADAVEVHESTVSRVTSNKYLQCPHGILELKYFFSSGVQQAAGDDVSAIKIKSRIKQLVGTENPKKPMSDQGIVKALEQDGIKCARRTVAKYREAMGLLSSSKRKRLF